MELKSDIESAVKIHQPCSDCGSSDALTVYSDHTYCFSCQTHTWTDGKSRADLPEQPTNHAFTDVSFQDLPSRKISERTCRKFSYGIGQYRGKKAQIAQYRDNTGLVVSQKCRLPDKKFPIVGNHSNVQLFGQHLWQPGKKLVITEGEVDCLSYAEITDCRWPVVSIVSGAASAVSCIERNIEFVESFDQVILMFDQDEQGQTAARKVADILTPGKAAIASLSLKDANEMLLAGLVKELSQAVWQANPVRPDGIINAKEIWNDVSKNLERGLAYPFSRWNDLLFGCRSRELLCITAGSGVGKSTVCAEIAYQFGIVENKNVGYVALEESLARTGQRLMSIAAGTPLHLPNTCTLADKKKAFDATLGTGNFYLYDHFGSIDSTNLIRKLKYMVAALDVEIIILDHLSIVVSGLDGNDDERKAIDYTMTELRSFAERTNVSLIVVSHLRRPGGDKGHEGGEKVYLSHLRGSAAIAQLSDAVISISRDMSSGDNNLEVTCLKNRYAGLTGPMGTLAYTPETGRLSEVADIFGDDEDCEPSPSTNTIKKATRRVEGR